MPYLANDSGMQPRVIYGDDGTPYIYGQDADGNYVLLDSQSAQPWWANTINDSVQAVGSIFGARRYPYGYDPGVYAQTQVSPQGISTGFNISKEMLLIGGLLLAVFFFGKGRR